MIRAREPQHPRRDVRRILHCQRTGHVMRHVPADEGGEHPLAGHAGTDGEAVAPSHGGRKRAQCLRPMTARAGGLVRPRATPRITVHTHRVRTHDHLRGLQRVQVGHHVAHVTPIFGQCASCEASRDALVHALLDGFDRATPRTVFRIPRRDADPGHRGLAPAVIEMTARAAQRVATISWQAVGEVLQQRQATRRIVRARRRCSARHAERQSQGEYRRHEGDP